MSDQSSHDNMIESANPADLVGLEDINDHHSHEHEHGDNCHHSHAHEDHNHECDNEVYAQLIASPDHCESFMHHMSHQHEHGHDHAHGHDHDHCHDHGHVKHTWRLVTMMVLTGTVFLVELVTGFITGSLALQGDAFHMFSDLASLIIGLYAHKLSKRPPTDGMSFGYTRAEVLGGLINATFMLSICLTILLDAIQRFIEPQIIKQPDLFLVVGAVGLVVNLLGLFIFHDHGHSENLEGVFIHILGDTFGSIGVMISAVVVKYSNWKGKDYLDPAISIFFVILISMGSFNLLKRTSRTVLEATPSSVDTQKLREEILSVDGILSIHELHVWELAKKCYISSIHLVVDKKEHNTIIVSRVHNIMMRYWIMSSTIQTEFVDDYPAGVQSVEKCAVASSFHADKRCFSTPPLFEHTIGCPHIIVDPEETP